MAHPLIDQIFRIVKIAHWSSRTTTNGYFAQSGSLPDWENVGCPLPSVVQQAERDDAN
jgi:hypothetical protein